MVIHTTSGWEGTLEQQLQQAEAVAVGMVALEEAGESAPTEHTEQGQVGLGGPGVRQLPQDLQP